MESELDLQQLRKRQMHGRVAKEGVQSHVKISSEESKGLPVL
jgi:hypothetical protein